jgi:hypothetical protein
MSLPTSSPRFTVPGSPPGLLRLLLPPAIAIIIVFAACGDDDDEVETEATVPVDTRVGKEETAVPTEAQDPETGLPALFPEEFPIYQGATVFRASEYEDRYLVEWRTVDDVGDVSAFYSENLAQEPWTVDGSDESEGTVAIAFSGELDDDYSGSLAIAPSGDEETKIVLNLSVDS